MDAPAWDFMGQIEVESACREGVTAFDGGMGLGQFMPKTAEWIQEQEKDLQEVAPAAAPYEPKWAIRALILYDRRLYRAVDCTDWHYVFRAYNGGLAAINREISRAASCAPDKVAAACSRKVLRLKSGLLDLCRVNIEYPGKVKAAGRKYRGRL